MRIRCRCASSPIGWEKIDCVLVSPARSRQRLVSALELVLIAAAVGAGAIAQRITGMGFVLVALPVLVWVLGPVDGVLVANVGSAVSAALMMLGSWRLIEWRTVALLGVPAIVGLVPGAILVALLGGAALNLIVGVSLILALTSSLVVVRSSRPANRTRVAMVTGFGTGFMSVIAGLGGPTLAIFRMLTAWEHRAFAATIQPLFFSLSMLALAAKAGAGILPPADLALWASVLVALVLGHLVGRRAARGVPPGVARVGVLVISYLGAVSVIVGGVQAIWFSHA